MTEQLTPTAAAPDSLAILRESYALHLEATRSPKTRDLYLGALDRLLGFLRERGMPTTARAVRREHVEAYFADRRESVAAATLSLEFRALQQFWKWALEEDEVDRDPMAKMKPPRVPERPVPVVTPEQLRALLRVVEGRDFASRRDRAAILLLYDSGMRAGELIGLRVADLDLRARTAFVTGKAGHSRYVRFGATTAVAIDRYLRARRLHRHAASEALWLGQDGPLRYSGQAQLLLRRCREAGLPRLHAHQFRHSFAHAYLAAGGNETDLQRLAGWRSPLMLRRYGASLADARARANYRSPVDGLER